MFRSFCTNTNVHLQHSQQTKRKTLRLLDLVVDCNIVKGVDAAATTRRRVHLGEEEQSLANAGRQIQGEVRGESCGGRVVEQRVVGVVHIIASSVATEEHVRDNWPSRDALVVGDEPARVFVEHEVAG